MKCLQLPQHILYSIRLTIQEFGCVKTKGSHVGICVRCGIMIFENVQQDPSFYLIFFSIITYLAS